MSEIATAMREAITNGDHAEVRALVERLTDQALSGYGQADAWRNATRADLAAHIAAEVADIAVKAAVDRMWALIERTARSQRPGGAR